VGGRHYATGHGGRRPADDLSERPGYSPRFNSFKPGDNSPVHQHDRLVTTHAMDFLKNRKTDDKPFFMIAGYFAPHPPLIVPQAYYDAYKDRVPMPVIPEGSVAAQPLNYQHLRAGFHFSRVPPEIVKRGRELYYGNTQWVDEQIGQVLGALASSAMAQNTIVIYTADHGENMGEHALWWKNCMFESAARVPLIVSYPQRWPGGQRRQGVCSLVDVVRTVAELGGAQVPADWNGQSLAPLLDDPQAKWKDMAVSEYYAHNIASGYAMIRSGRFKYVYHTAPDARHAPQRELYDLISDPGEFTNLSHKPNHRDQSIAMHEALIAEIGEPPDNTEQRCRADYARGYFRQDPPENGAQD
jgi:choline-sulfatase